MKGKHSSIPFSWIVLIRLNFRLASELAFIDRTAVQTDQRQLIRHDQGMENCLVTIVGSHRDQVGLVQGTSEVHQTVLLLHLDTCDWMLLLLGHLGLMIRLVVPWRRRRRMILLVIDHILIPYFIVSSLRRAHGRHRGVPPVLILLSPFFLPLFPPISPSPIPQLFKQMITTRPLMVIELQHLR